MYKHTSNLCTHYLLNPQDSSMPLLFSRSVVFNSLWPRGVQHARHPWQLSWQRVHLQCRFNYWVGKLSCRRNTTPVCLGFPGGSAGKESTCKPLVGEFYGQRSLAGYSPWDHKESNLTERLFAALWSRCSFIILLRMSDQITEKWRT